MNHSESLDLLATALADTQAEIKDTIKDSDGYGYKYAKLPQLLSLNRSIWAKHGLSIVQMPINDDNNNLLIESVLLHKSGQWISSSVIFAPLESKNMNLLQGLGAAITYMRRYILSSVFALASAEEDDDGVSAPNPPYHGRQNKKAPLPANNEYLPVSKLQEALDKIEIAPSEDELVKYHAKAFANAGMNSNKDALRKKLDAAKDKKMLEFRKDSGSSIYIPKTEEIQDIPQ